MKKYKKSVLTCNQKNIAVHVILRLQLQKGRADLEAEFRELVVVRAVRAHINLVDQGVDNVRGSS